MREHCHIRSPIYLASLSYFIRYAVFLLFVDPFYKEQLRCILDCLGLDILLEFILLFSSSHVVQHKFLAFSLWLLLALDLVTEIEMSRPVPVSDTEGCEPQSHELASLEHDTSSQQSPVQFPETIQTATTDARVRNESRVPSPQSEGASTLVASEPSSQNGHCSPPSATPGNPPRSNISVVQFVRSRWPNAANTQTMLAWSVVVLTIVTVVYSWRANLMQNWNNEAALYEYCHEVHVRT